ncbi:unnamed protein product [Leptosia nina]|uniref:Reverse transcriptase domain-containing protein n=1 Tax=Leptosia nina TaxID=320188 RepID=A0AAV1JW69_9NEOP
MAVPTGVTLVAYADDVTVLVEANSRAEIERKAAATLELAVQWGERICRESRKCTGYTPRAVPVHLP